MVGTSIPASRATVKTCYSLVERFFPECGLFDLTEGMYYGLPGTTYEEAQRNQRDYLLDEIQCRAGSRVLDLGCGYGTVIKQARERGAAAVGITLSPEQLRRCRASGLDVHLLDYRELGEPPSGFSRSPDRADRVARSGDRPQQSWHGAFDGVIANGSIEHFAHPRDAIEGRDDEVYRQMFGTVHRLIDPGSQARRLVTTTIHFVQRPDPRDLLRWPLAHASRSEAYHYAMLERSYGGWYPAPGQLERCAAGHFELIAEEDGTRDYERTSEEWLRRVRRKIFSSGGVEMLLRTLPVLLRHPVQYPTMLWCILGSESWNWQFRPPAPTRLLRQTWRWVAGNEQ